MLVILRRSGKRLNLTASDSGDRRITMSCSSLILLCLIPSRPSEWREKIREGGRGGKLVDDTHGLSFAMMSV